MEGTLYTQDGKEKGALTLPKELFGLSWNADLVHQVVMSMLGNARAGTADTKGRGEVRGGGKKPWKQKGTGRARHGSIRSPIWKGGGVTHGPLAEKNYKRKINKKMKTKALYTVLSKKLKDGEVLFIDSVNLKEAKTKNAATVVQSLAGIKGFSRLSGKKPTALLTIPGKDDGLMRSMRNLPQIELEYVKDINPAQVLAYKYLVITAPEESMKVLLARSAK